MAKTIDISAMRKCQLKGIFPIFLLFKTAIKAVNKKEIKVKIPE